MNMNCTCLVHITTDGCIQYMQLLGDCRRRELSSSFLRSDLITSNEDRIVGVAASRELEVIEFSANNAGMYCMNSFNNTIHKYRRVDSPLPAVPLPPKFVTLNRNAKNLASGKEFSSCEDLSKQQPQTPKKTLGYISASQTPHKSVNVNQPKFNMACKFTVQDDPLLSYGKSMFSDETLKPARNHSHDYEELTDQGTQVPNSSHQHGNSTLLRPQANGTGGGGKEPHNRNDYQMNTNEKSPTTISTVATSRERQNPMYAGYEPPKTKRSASQSTSDDSDSDKALYGRGISRKQKTKILLMFIIVLTTCISIAALTTTTLFAFGILSPHQSYENSENSNLKENIAELAIKTGQLSDELHGKLQQVDRRMVNQNRTVDDLMITVKNLSESSMDGGSVYNRNNKLHHNGTTDVRNTSEYQNLITEYENLLNSLRDKSSNCRHETFSIGSSSSQEFTESGEYYADDSYVITGVTCSSTTGYVSTLRSRMDGGKTKYKCVCHRSEENIVGMFGNRVECRIHYWQCPN